MMRRFLTMAVASISLAGWAALPEGYVQKRCVTIPNTTTHNGVVTDCKWSDISKIYIKYATTDAGGNFMLLGSVKSKSDCSGCGATWLALKNGTATVGDTGQQFSSVSGSLVPSDRKTYYRDGKVRWLTVNLDSNSDSKLLLFGCGWSDTSWSKTADWYAVKIYDTNGDKVADFVPCVRSSDSEVGFYDTVTGTFFGRGRSDWTAFTATDLTPGEEEAESARPDARAYIRDGLILQLDGIENAGFGVHDASAATWADLVGGHVLTAEGTPAWGSDHMVFDGTTSKALVGSSPKAHAAMEAKGATVEMCCLPTADASNAGPWAFGSTGNYTLLKAKDKQFGYYHYVRGKCGELAKAPSGFQTVSLRLASDYWHFYSAGTSLGGYVYGSATGSDDFTIGRLCYEYPENYVQMKAYSFRIYSRALTADELAYNARVDEVRFNPPDIPFSECAVRVTGEPYAFGTSTPAYGTAFVDNMSKTATVTYELTEYDDGVSAIAAADGVRGQFAGGIVQTGQLAPVTNLSASVPIDLTCGRLDLTWFLRDIQYRVRITGSSEVSFTVNGGTPVTSYEGWFAKGEKIRLKATSSKGNRFLTWGDAALGGEETTVVAGQSLTLTPTYANFIVEPGSEAYAVNTNESAAVSVETRVKDSAETDGFWLNTFRRGLNLIVR